MKTLWKQGGVRRFYRGLTPALLQGPMSRFCDTAANTGVLTLMSQHPTLSKMPSAAQSVFASATAASMRIMLMPIDTVKTTLQVEGKGGLQLLRQKVKTSPLALWHGSMGACTATFVGHYPWFATYNFLQSKVRFYLLKSILYKLTSDPATRHNNQKAGTKCGNWLYQFGCFRLLFKFASCRKSKFLYLANKKLIYFRLIVKRVAKRSRTFNVPVTSSKPRV